MWRFPHRRSRRLPDHESGMLVDRVIAGNAATVEVGLPESIVFVKMFVTIGALTSKTIEADALIF